MSPDRGARRGLLGCAGVAGPAGLEHGASADLVCYSDDPRLPGVLDHPDLVILRGACRTVGFRAI